MESALGNLNLEEKFINSDNEQEGESDEDEHPKANVILGESFRGGIFSDDELEPCEPLTLNLVVCIDEELSVSENFQRAYDNDEKLRAALQAYNVDSFNDEAKEQILSAYTKHGASGIEIEVYEAAEDSGEATEIDSKFVELCQAEPDL